MRDISHHLEAEISKAVDLIMAASEAAAIEALGRAFGVRGFAQHRRGSAGRSRATPKSTNGREAERGAAMARRSREEIAALETRLSEAIIAEPGQTMKVLAERLGVGCRDLQIPASRLRTAGSIKTIGERQLTRYFPVSVAIN